MPLLLYLKPGTRFRLAEAPDVTATLIRATESRALVRVDRPAEEVEFVEEDGRARRFKAHASRVTSWTSLVLVEPIGFEFLDPEENDMSKSKSKKASGTKPAGKKREGGKLSCLDAAAKVLGEKKEPMSTAEMIEVMATKGYWKSPGGKTPAATLYSAILRELGKGKDSRFKKTERGKFALA